MPAPGAWGECVLLNVIAHMWRKRLYPAPPFVRPPIVVLTFMSGLGSVHICACCPLRLSPHNQPSFFPRYDFQSLTFNTQPQLHWWMWVSVWGAQSGSTDNLWRSLSFFFPNWLLKNPLSIWSFPSILFGLPAGKSGSQGRGSFPLIQLPLRGKCPVLISFSLSLYFVLPSYVEIHLALSESLGLLAAFSRYFVRSAPHVDIFWYICGRK